MRSVSSLFVLFVLAFEPVFGADEAAPTIKMFQGAAPLEHVKHKYGLFVHYAWGGTAYTVTVNRDGSKPAGLQDLADRFDAVGFANDVKLMGVEYVIFTAWHADMNLLYPSPKMEQWFAGTGLRKTSRRDVIRDLIDALKPTGIKLYLYVHPADGHDMTATEQNATGYNDAAPFTKWNAFINDIFGEICERYGADVCGYWCDAGPKMHSEGLVDLPRLRATLKTCDPNKLIMSSTWVTNMQHFIDLYSWETYFTPGKRNQDGENWLARAEQISQVEGSTWWASTAYGAGHQLFSPEALFRFTVLEAGANTKGMGVAWAAGCYPGGGWEMGVKECLQQVGAYIMPIAVSIKGVYASTSYITAPGATLNGIAWGVATKSIDGLTEYIHVLKPPAAAELDLPTPADRKRFTAANMLRSGRTASLVQNESGVHITIPEAWDALDTVIKLKVDAGSIP